MVGSIQNELNDFL